MKGKAIIPLALGLGMGLLAIKFGMDTVKKARGASAEQARKVIRARQDIEPTVAITQEMIELVATADKPGVSDPDFSDVKTMIGRVTSKAIPQGATILKSMLAEPGTPPGVPGRISPGYRAVSVEIDEVTGVAFNVRPGDWVDVIVVMDLQQQGSREKETIAEVVLHRIEVAAVGLGTAGTQKGNASSKGKAARSATLLVPEADVPKLHLAAVRGKITLAMRGEEETLVTNQSFTARSSQIMNNDSSTTSSKDSSGSADAGKGNGASSGSGGLLSLATEWLKASTDAAKTAPAVASPQAAPFSMILSYGTTVPGGKTQTYRITYENSHSNNVIAVRQGPQVNSNGLSPPGPSPTTSSQPPQPQPTRRALSEPDKPGEGEFESEPEGRPPVGQ